MAPGRTLEKKLRRVVEGDVRFDPGALALYSTDASNYRRVPLGIVVPRNAGDVLAALEIARENALPVLARGGGTSLAGQACNAALVLDFSRYMTAVGAVDANRRLAVVEPGVVPSRLNAELLRAGLFFAPDPTTRDRCTVGGMIGNNSCGAHSAAYGKTVDNVAAVDAVLYDGTRLSLAPLDPAGLETKLAARGRETELYAAMLKLGHDSAEAIRSRYPKIPRRVSGYNLDQLLPENEFNPAGVIVGSEGTLAITLGATLKLVPRPKSLVLVALGFEDVFEAADATPVLLGHRPQALEGFDHRLVDFARAAGFEGAGLLPDGRAFLLVELDAESEADACERARALEAHATRAMRLSGSATFLDPGAQQALWGLRDSGLGAGAFITGRPRTWPGAEDAAVAPERLGAYLRRFDDLLKRHALEPATYYGHFGEGCVHCRINFDLTTPAGIATFRAAMIGIADLVGEFGGSLSGEHGDGIARSELLPRIFGAEIIAAFRTLKHAFDPDRRMNPGVLVDPEPLDSHLRLGPRYRPAAVATHFDLSADGGLAGAALKCVGIGKCRKLDAGTMCPSYMATRDETHSTRGRARLLLEALSGDLLPGGFADRALFEALELCLSCKGCKRECPSRVDMAAYKAEFLANYYRSHRRPLNARVFGRVHELARLVALVPGTASAIWRAPGLCALVKRALSIHPERELPRPAARTFGSWFRRRAPAPPAGHELLLFVDTFTNFFEPEVGIAAVSVLERAGFRPILPPGDLCCGRPLYEQGMLRLARQRLAAALSSLGPFVARGVPIVGLEPSCTLTFRDELLMLFPKSEAALALSRSTFLLDEFLERSAPDFLPPALVGRALLHGHCHQKAVTGITSEVNLLGRVRGLQVEALDSGCCGMAGAFGYARDHFELSRAIGERRLLPAVRQSAPDTIVVADGFACRTQIRQFCPGRRALHLAQVLNGPHRLASTQGP